MHAHNCHRTIEMGIQDDYLDPDRHLWPAEEPEAYSKAWDYLNALIWQWANEPRDYADGKTDMEFAKTFDVHRARKHGCE